ncbi:DUF2147 domain-containing protein [Arcicella rigui]|uniref:DUF2147 domain-containing protein n=1 Tax=Arcicella rigui TaxID=797020 RepID=A0ABU5Q6C7_9BACT|nr:DUF2147 domain-containing protein [Arcicella rigui]MEA5138147.1 DUF2147 domain-containing protein [Arcicella rigui]
MRNLKLFLIILLSSSWTFASNEDSELIVGTWFTDDKASKIQIYKVQNQYFGKVVWLKNPLVNGKAVTDSKNPDSKLRSRSVLGLTIFNNFIFEGNNTWTDGEIYDVRTGRTVAGKMSLKNKNTLDLRGYIGKPIFGKTVTLYRAE